MLFIMRFKRKFKIILYFLLLFNGLLIKEHAAVFVNPFLQSQQKRLYMVRSGNLRESNDINSSIITVLDSGTVMVEIEKDNVKGWFHVELEDGTIGWIYHSLLGLYEDDYQEKGGSEMVVKIDEESEMKSEEVKEEDNEVELEENVSLQLDGKSTSESVPQIIENPVNKYLYVLVIVLLLTNASLVLLFYKSRKKLQSIVISSKNATELEIYKKENEKLNEKVLFLEKKISQLEKEIEEEDIQVVASEESEVETLNSESKISDQREELDREIDSSLNLYKIYMHQFIQKIRQSYS